MALTVMQPGERRALTRGERAALSPGLADALDAAGAVPVIVARAAVLARVAGLWRGSAPILVLGDRIYWPGAPHDLSRSIASMPILQHELQHVLDYATGALGVVRYGLDPRNWIYRYRLDASSRWSGFGAEQRAQVVQDLWTLERAGADCDQHRRVIPWAS